MQLIRKFLRGKAGFLECAFARYPAYVQSVGWLRPLPAVLRLLSFR